MDPSKIRLSRRSILEVAALAMTSTSITGCGEEDPGQAKQPGITESETVAPWSNWSGNQHCEPTRRIVPRDEAQLCEVIRNSQLRIRFVGSGHSFSPLVPTWDTLVTLDALRGVQSVNPETGEALILGGTRLSEIGEPLWERNRALFNMPDINTQSLAGALATSTHGTGATLGSMSSDVTRLWLVGANGGVIECSPSQDSAVFNAARTSLGALGAVSQVGMRTRAAYKLLEYTWMMPLKEGLERAPELGERHRHFAMYALPYADYILGIVLDETTAPDSPKQDADRSDEEAFQTVIKLTDALPFLRSMIVNAAARRVQPRERLGRSYEIFGSRLRMRMNEMEYAVPAEQGPACLHAILSKIRRDNIDVMFPLQYRYVKADDIWLSPFYGRDSCAISCHNFHDRDYRKYFAAIEPIFWRFGGRPHPGKVHSLQAEHFERLYPRWWDFLRVRRELDPRGKFLNDHLVQVFGL